MTKSKIWIAASVLVLIGVGTWLWLRFSGQNPDPQKSPVATPSIALSGVDKVTFSEGSPQLAMLQSRAIEASPIPVSEPLSAKVVYDENETARVSVSFTGRITRLKAAAGDVVKAGQVLAEIDSPDFGSATADLSKAKADEERKHQLVERAKRLVPGEAISIKDWEALQSDYAQAQAERARAELRLKNLNPHDLTVTGQRVSLASPIDGVITERNASLALEVSPALQAPLFVVTELRKLWLLIDLPERLTGRIHVGDAVSIDSDAFAGERFNAKIVQVGQLVDPNSRRVVARAVIDNPQRKLLPEMYVRASILQSIGKGVKVPNSAIINRGLYNFVYIQTGNTEFQRRMVTPVTRGSDHSYIGEGLQGGERIVIKGALLLDAEASSLPSEKK